MNSSNNTAVSVRAFTVGDFYSGTAGLMPGGNVDFGAIVIVRDLAPTSSTEQLFGNFNDPAGADNTQGWRILRLADDAGGDDVPALTNYAVEIYGGAATITVPFSISASHARGRLIWIAFTFDAATDECVVFVNGGFANSATVAITPLASTLGPTIGGHSVAAVPAVNTSIFAAAYFTAIDVDTPTALSASFVESIKRCDIVPVTGLAFDYHYTVARDSGFAGSNGTGYPRTLVNYGGNAPAGDLTKQGTDALVIATAPVIWSGEAIVQGV